MKKQDSNFEESPVNYNDKDLLFYFNLMHDFYSNKLEEKDVVMNENPWGFEDIINYYVLILDEMFERGLDKVRFSELDNAIELSMDSLITESEGPSKSGPEISAEKIQAWCNKYFILVEGITSLTGDIVSEGKTEKGFEHTIKVPRRHELIRMIKSCLRKTLPNPEIREMQNVALNLSGRNELADHIKTYDLVLVPTENRDAIKAYIEEVATIDPNGEGDKGDNAKE